MGVPPGDEFVLGVVESATVVEDVTELFATLRRERPSEVIAGDFLEII
jgi:hypothetical protein